MSGGVDSSVVAALLKIKGFDVIGVTMNVLPSELNREFGECCSLSSVEDARKVAKALKIPHYVLNLKDLFKKKVINNFYSEYMSGKTPNPCIRCNQYIKFNVLLNKVRGLKGDFLATGHYARVEYNKKRKRFLLKKGKDKNKDQSYVLYTLTQEQLKHVLFPLGNYNKSKVREIARKMKLSVADKEESQEICFVENNDYAQFLREHFKAGITPGNIINKEGEVLGRHKGIINYTIGQRKGLGISAKKPLYVTDIRTDANEVVAGFKEEVYGNELVAENINLISTDRISKPIKIKAKIRYKNEASNAVLMPVKRGFAIKFEKPQWAITPGQSVVFYERDMVIGGGIISTPD